MKKKLLVPAIVFGMLGGISSAQSNISVPLSDPIYEIIDIANMKGACEFPTAARPYTEKKIVAIIDEILDGNADLTDMEISILKEYRSKYADSDSRKNSIVHVTLKDEKLPISFNYDFTLETYVSGGFYNESDMSSAGFDIIPNIAFSGDLTNKLNYRMNIFFDFTKMPLYEPENSNYTIGSFFYPDGPYKEDFGKTRSIKKLMNTSYLPFKYNKRWTGQCFFFSNVSADGLEGWATEAAYGYGIDGELRGSFLDNRINLGIGKHTREIAAMDNGSSLVLNSSARPFYAVDATVDLLPALRLSWLTGILEYPNQDYLLNRDYYGSYQALGEDAYFFQNAFSLLMFELDVKNVHFDIGTTAVWPKRFELGYLIPLAFYLEYQNHIGDYDNLAFFGNLKITKENQAYWASLFLDEISAEVIKGPFSKERAMFAFQVGGKYAFQNLSFATASFRYTKVEPYCYTHQSINYTPWYDHYIAENYTNNGECLGYYLPPNSDEFLFALKFKPKTSLDVNASYQLIRHGADYGSHQVRGSSLYSELPKSNRGSAKKRFIEDGAYNWMHILSVGGTYRMKDLKVLDFNLPIELFANAGILISHYSDIDDDDYTPGAESDNTINNKGKFHFRNTDEYPFQIGAVFTAGIKIFGK